MTPIDKEKDLIEKETGSEDISGFVKNAEMPEYEPSNSELMAEIQKNRQLIKTALFFSILTLLLFIGVSYYLYTVVISYKIEIDEAFQTMKKIDTMVEQLEADYGSYSQKVDEFFNTVNELKANLDNVNRILGSLSNLRLPF